MSTRRATLLLFLIPLLVCVFFTERSFQTSNFNSRYYAMMAYTQDFTIKLNKYKDKIGYDQAIYKGDNFGDKPPGSSLLLAVPYHLVVRPINVIYKLIFGKAIHKKKRAWMTQVLTLGILGGIAAYSLFRIFLCFGFAPSRAFLFAILGFSTTLTLPYLTYGLGAMFVTPLVFLLLWVLMEKTGISWALIAGLLSAFIFITMYQLLILLLGVGLFLLVNWGKESWKSLLLHIGAYSLPLVIAGMGILLLNYFSFGDPMSFATHFAAPRGIPREAGQVTSVLRFSFPGFGKLYDMLFSGWKGIFFYSPVLILFFPQLYKMTKERSVHSLLFFLPFLLMFIFFFFNIGWKNGVAIGFRYFVPVFPFLVIPAFLWVNEAGSKIKSFAQILIIWSGLISLLILITDPRVGNEYKSPIIDFNFNLLMVSGPQNVIFNQSESAVQIAMAWLSTMSFLLILTYSCWHEHSKLRSQEIDR